jgi:hypothetical protein
VLTVLTIALLGVILTSGGLGLSSLFILNR